MQFTQNKSATGVKIKATGELNLMKAVLATSTTTTALLIPYFLEIELHSIVIIELKKGNWQLK